ncbi:MAG TPA: hypothetical protein VEU62_00785 [Bryobacterales bacterium]|nr:hypothetical protein [Bryobacterales bacterium]
MTETQVLTGPPEAVRQKLEARRRDLSAQLKLPNLEGLRAFVCLLEECIHALNCAIAPPESLALFLQSSVLQCGFPALVWFRRGDAARAAEWITRAWEAHAAAFTAFAAEGSLRSPVGHPVAPDPAELEFLSVYNLAISELLGDRLKDAEARLMLRGLMAHLGLGLSELGRIFGVTADAIRSWEFGYTHIPNEEMGELRAADHALRRLLELFRPERLPQVIRRKADLFEKERALEWILRGQIAEVADRYDATLGYQG